MSVAHEETLATRGLRLLEQRVEAELLCERGHRRRHAKRVRPALDEVTVDAFAERSTARARTGFEHEHFASRASQRRSRREPRDPGADDDALDVAHASDRAASVKARTPSTGVSGRQPWPRFST